MTRNTKQEAARWASNLGATPEEAESFSRVVPAREKWDYVLGLMNKAGFLRLQPWIARARDVELFLKSYNLPFHRKYSAIHVRRGDKLAVEARGEVVRYWRSHWHVDPNNLPTDYVIASYVALIAIIQARRSRDQSAECPCRLLQESELTPADTLRAAC